MTWQTVILVLGIMAILFIGLPLSMAVHTKAQKAWDFSKVNKSDGT